MNRLPSFRALLLGLGLGLVLMPEAVQACATCYGESDAPMAQGMNWGILSLLVVIGSVLGGVTSFFVFLGWRASKVASENVTVSDLDH